MNYICTHAVKLVYGTRFGDHVNCKTKNHDKTPQFDKDRPSKRDFFFLLLRYVKCWSAGLNYPAVCKGLLWVVGGCCLLLVELHWHRRQ